MRWITRERVQIDRLASAWLIRRFVDPQAEFHFVPRGAAASDVTDGIPFQLPGGELAPMEGRSTFEAILNTYHLAPTDPALAELGSLVRAADHLHGAVAFRHQSVRDALLADAPPETAGLQMLLHGIRRLATDDQDAIDRATVALDAVYAALRAHESSATAGSSS